MKIIMLIKKIIKRKLIIIILIKENINNSEKFILKIFILLV